MAWFDFLDPNQQQQPQPQQAQPVQQNVQPSQQPQTDWGSIAKSLLPGVLPGVAGLAFGGRNRGLYGAYGFAEGMASQEAQDIARQKYNIDQATKQRKEAAQEKHWEAADKVAEQNAQLHQMQMKEAEQKLLEAQSSQEARERFAASITDPAERDRFLVDPKGYMKDRLDQQKIQGAGQVLSTLGVPEGDKLAATLGAQGTGKLIESMATARYAQKPFHYYDSAAGTLVWGVPGGKINTQQVVDHSKIANSKDPEHAHAIMQEAQQQVESRFKGALGEMRFDAVPGKDDEEKAKNYQRMIDQRAYELAKSRGMPNLFAPPPPTETERAGAFIRARGGAAPAGKRGVVEAAQPPKGKQVFEDLPDASKYPNKIVVNPATGERRISNGESWVTLK